MKLIVCENYQQLSEKAAEIVSAQIINKRSCVLGLATGSTPIGLYDQLVSMNQKGTIDFSNVTTVNLDEYYPISPNNPQSYRYFMNKYLFSKINIDLNNTFVPRGDTKDADGECEFYEKLIEQKGGIDLQVLGVGQNGHIGFNEPCENLNAVTHLTGLTKETIQVNSRFFEKDEFVPDQAITMGMGSILKARKVILLANGKQKHDVIKNMLNSNVNTSMPVTLLKLHADFTLICDKEAFEG